MDLGEIEKIRIKHDDSGAASGWFLDSINILEPNTKPVTLVCKRWLDTREVCMYAYIYVYLCITPARMYAFLYVCMHSCIYMIISVSVYSCMRHVLIVCIFLC